MDINRRIIVQGIKTDENVLIPLWDERLSYEKTKLFGNKITITMSGDRREKSFNLVECVYDLKTKQIEAGIGLNYYPPNDELEFKVGEVVLVEKTHRCLIEAKIVEIVYDEYDLVIKRGKKLDKYWVNRFKHFEIDGNALYAIKQWKPFYLLDNGTKIENTYQLYHKFK